MKEPAAARLGRSGRVVTPPLSHPPSRMPRRAGFWAIPPRDHGATKDVFLMSRRDVWESLCSRSPRLLHSPCLSSSSSSSSSVVRRLSSVVCPPSSVLRPPSSSVLVLVIVVVKVLVVAVAVCA